MTDRPVLPATTEVWADSRPDSLADSWADTWAVLARHTPARIAQGRAGSGLPTKPYLAFQAAHARARDAVHAGLDVAALVQEIGSLGLQAITVRSAAVDRHVYLKRPDLGRMLDADSVARLSEPMVAPDVAIVIGDGLSSVAVARNAVAVLGPLYAMLRERGLTIGPIIIATEARVALADHVGEILQAKCAVIMLGERPGLSVADSLGMYLTYAPNRSRRDGERNCISNIHAGGMAAADAAARACDLITAMFAHRTSGVALTLSRGTTRDA